MQPSSFVFVAIVALWAAYLLPQWIRRRDDLWAARGADRHSAALRVLDRRRRRPGPARSSAPILLASRIVTAPAGPSQPLPEPVLPVSRTANPASAPAVVSAARRRAVVLATLVTVTLLAISAAVAGVVPAAVAVLPAVLLGLDVAALRAFALREGRRRADEVARAEARARRTRAHELAAARARAAVPAPATASAPAVAPAPRPAPEPVVARPVAATDRTWVPVPVPPPTYTLKPVAPRPEPAPLEPQYVPAAFAPAVPAAVAAAAPAEPEVDLDNVLERRRAVNG